MGAGRVSPEDNGGYLIIINNKILRSTSNFASLLGINGYHVLANKVSIYLVQYFLNSDLVSLS